MSEHLPEMFLINVWFQGENITQVNFNKIQQHGHKIEIWVVRWSILFYSSVSWRWFQQTQGGWRSWEKSDSIVSWVIEPAALALDHF